MLPDWCEWRISTDVSARALTFHRHMVIETPWIWAHVVWTHTQQNRRHCKPLLHFLFPFFSFLSFVLPWKIYDGIVENEIEIVLKDKTPRSKSTQTATGEKDKTSTNSTIANNATRPKPEGRLAGDVHKGDRKKWRCTTRTTRNMEHMKHEPRLTGNCKTRNETCKHCNAWC